jgi:cobalt-zinc-cadmium resistance protein CzcA
LFDKIISYSINNKFVIGILVATLILWGLFSLSRLPIDAVPDITNNQVQIITSSPSLATQEVEQFITTPIELSLQNIQQLVEIRSISRFGLSVVTVVFDEEMDTYLARQLVSEHIKIAKENIPEGLGSPEMSPIATGLGEIYQYVVFAKEGYEEKFNLSELRTTQDWLVKRQLTGIEGVVEVNTLGGYLKQYEVSIDPDIMKSMNLSITEVFDALNNSNESTGGAYIEKGPKTYYIRSSGTAKSMSDIENILVKMNGNSPIVIKDIAKVQFGQAPRYGALTRDGQEAVGGTVMMLKGENSRAVSKRIKERMAQIEKTLPEGIAVEAYLDRDKLVSTAIGTVRKNLIEGGLIVVFILVLMLGNWRASLIVASVIPLSMLFAVGLMKQFGISANLMSLGAIDFGLIVDGAVIIVEAIVHRLRINHGGATMSQKEMDGAVYTASKNIRSSAAFGEIIILMVYIPILALVGIEGKMFKPMAQTVMLAIAGALVLSLTYVPMMASLFLNKKISAKITFADKIISWCHRQYAPLLEKALQWKRAFVTITLGALIFSLILFARMGGEFIPTLEEGDFALHQILPAGSSLSQSVKVSTMIQKKLMKEFPEIEDIVTKMGSAEIPTDPMPIETGDIIIIMKPKSEWTSATTRQGMFDKMEESLMDIPGVKYEFSQPIQMRFNELMTGSRADIAIKLYGDNLDELFSKGQAAEKLIKKLEGVGTVKVEQVKGMPQIVINYNYQKLAQYGLHVKDVNRIIKTAFAGDKAGTFYEGEKTFDLVVRFQKEYRKDINSVKELYIPLKNGQQIPITEIAEVNFETTPMQISRDNTKRRIVIGVNVGNRDVASLVEEIQETLDKEISLNPGYYFTYGGQFENLKAANKRLMIAVPLALGLIFVLLYFTFNSITQAMLIFSAIPLSAIGGILALQLRGMPFSISAGIGFIALFGVAVLNGIVLIGYFNQLKREGVLNLEERIKKGTRVRLRPVLMTAAVASFGFLPMALSSSGGGEVQRPLATVVIGGLLTATFLTLIILPILYHWLEDWKYKRNLKAIRNSGIIVLLFIITLAIPSNIFAQEKKIVLLDDAIAIGLKNNPEAIASTMKIDQLESLQKMRYNFGNTELGYQGDGLFEDNPQKVQQYSIGQEFSTFGVSKSRNNLREAELNTLQLEQTLTRNDLIRNIREKYFQLQHQMQMSVMYGNLLTIYKEYDALAKKRQDVGLSGKLEMMTMENLYLEHELLANQSKLEIESLEQELQYALGIEYPVTVPVNMDRLPYSLSDSLNAPQLKLAQQKISIEDAKADILKADMRPSFNLGYAAQNYFESGWLTNLNAGIKLPLFTNSQRKVAKAQVMEVDIAFMRYRAQTLAYKSQLSRIIKSIKLYQDGLDYYDKQLNIIGPEMMRIAKLNYTAGKISYVELTNILQLVAANNKKYLSQLLAYNLAVAEYQSLIKN